MNNLWFDILIIFLVTWLRKENAHWTKASQWFSKKQTKTKANGMELWKQKTRTNHTCEVKVRSNARVCHALSLSSWAREGAIAESFRHLHYLSAISGSPDPPTARTISRHVYYCIFNELTISPLPLSLKDVGLTVLSIGMGTASQLDLKFNEILYSFFYYFQI